MLESTRIQNENLGYMLRALAPHCAAIVIISEAWILGDASEYDTTKPVSEHANRKEGVFVRCHGGLQSGMQSGRSLVLSTTFEPDGYGKPVRPSRLTRTWQPIEGVVQTNFQGLFASA